MIDLIRESWGVVERLYDRLGTKSARGLDLDAAVVLTQCTVALEKSAEGIENTSAKTSEVARDG